MTSLFINNLLYAKLLHLLTFNHWLSAVNFEMYFGRFKDEVNFEM